MSPEAGGHYFWLLGKVVAAAASHSTKQPLGGWGCHPCAPPVWGGLGRGGFRGAAAGGSGIYPLAGGLCPLFGGVSALGGGGWGALRLCPPSCPWYGDEGGGDPQKSVPHRIQHSSGAPHSVSAPLGSPVGGGPAPSDPPNPQVPPNQPLISQPTPPGGWGGGRSPPVKDESGQGGTGRPSAAPHMWGSPTGGVLHASVRKTRSSRSSGSGEVHANPVYWGAASVGGKSHPASVSAPRRAPSGITVLPLPPRPPPSSSSSSPPESSLTAPSCRPFCRRRPR